MPRRQVFPKTVTWLSEEIYNIQSLTPSFHHYKKFEFGNITAGIGDFVLISNADAAEPDTENGCDAARILSLYEDRTNFSDPFRAKVQWYSRPSDLPNWCFNPKEPVNFFDKEVIEDHRPFNTDVSIETFFKKCTVTLTFTKDIDDYTNKPLHYICRYRLILQSRRKAKIEPVLEQERNALEILQTPNKTPLKSTTPKTPYTLVKRLSRISISEKNWSISKNDGTKLLLKRAILTDKNERDIPINATPKKNLKPSISKILTKPNIEELLSLELKENSGDELPTLIIRQHIPSTPKRKQTVPRTNEQTPKKVLVFEDNGVCIGTTRSGRSTKKPVNYLEEESPVKRTPRKTVHKMSETDYDFKPTPITPKTPKTPRTPKTPKTPRTITQTPKRSVTRKIMTSQLTPTLHNRTHRIDNIDDIFKQNNSLPGRESQMEEILSFVRSKLIDGSSGCMYISGVPGTGKTATVCSALKVLKEEDDLPDFQLVEVNGMRLAEPRQAYVQIYKQLTGKSVVWEQACALLEKRFTNPGPRRTPTVLLVDELDAVCTRRQDVLYSIMEWAAHGSALLTVLAVANTMDLPERALAARVASRLGLTRLTFPPYTHAQLQSIVATRLAGANVTADAVQLIASVPGAYSSLEYISRLQLLGMVISPDLNFGGFIESSAKSAAKKLELLVKVAAVSGDARRALALCARALELAGSGSAGLQEVQQALTEAASSAAVRAIKNCSPAERLMLRAIAAEVERTGTDETSLSRALSTAAAIVSLDGRPYRSATSIRAPTPAQAHAICARLSALRLILMEHRPAEPRLLLNVSPDDVHYATKQFTV